MKQIAKNNEPQAVLTWKAKADANWQPSYAELSGVEKRAIRDSLADEQGYICCYCNRDISDGDFHIEHFRPQETFPDKELEYNNLHVSCIKQMTTKTASHCGNAKANWFDNQLTLSPLDNHEISFKYLYDGNVEAGVPDASRMVDKLKLNEESLRAKREAEIAGMLDEQFINTATNDQLLNLLTKISRKNLGKYQEFTIAIQQQIKQLLPDNLAVNL
jgi:uncharacterized protein (TIGR02646 family)